MNRATQSTSPRSRFFQIGLAALVSMGAYSCASNETETHDVATAEPAWTPATAAESLLARSVAFHDPHGHFGSKTIGLTWSGLGTDGTERMRFEIAMAADQNDFTLEGNYGETQFEYSVEGSQFHAVIDGEAEYDDEARDKMVLGREDGMFWRNYFGFLGGLPMNLRSDDVHIDAAVEATQFMQQEVHAIRVFYEESVGTDTWYFYFEPESAELVGCKFTKADPAKPGEYLVFEELAEADGLRLPMRRRWYMNDDDRHLGNDEIVQLSVLP